LQAIAAIRELKDETSLCKHVPGGIAVPLLRCYMLARKQSQCRGSVKCFGSRPLIINNKTSSTHATSILYWKYSSAPAMKRKQSHTDEQRSCNTGREKRYKLECAPFRNRSASPRLHALTEAALLHVSQRTHSTTPSVDTWLATEEQDNSDSPPPLDASKLYSAPTKRQQHAMIPSAGEAPPTDGPKRQKTSDADYDYIDNTQREQSVSQLSTALVLSTRTTFSPPASQASSGFKRTSSQSSPTHRSRSSSPRKPAATREDQLGSFIPGVQFAVLDQAQRYSVHIPDSLKSLVKQFEVSSFSSSAICRSAYRVSWLLLPRCLLRSTQTMR
jgi:hypothetical protein